MKTFILSYWESVKHSKEFKAKSKKELERKFFGGELELDDKDIVDGEYDEGSLEIEEEVS